MNTPPRVKSDQTTRLPRSNSTANANITATLKNAGAGCSETTTAKATSAPEIANTAYARRLFGARITRQDIGSGQGPLGLPTRAATRFTIQAVTESPDTPLGPIGKVLGLSVDAPAFAPDEMVIWEARANRFQARVRSIGGRIYLTDRQLVFAPNKLERKVAGQAWSAPLAELERAFVKGPMKTVRILSHSGAEEKFVIWPREESAERIDQAIQAAQTTS